MSSSRRTTGKASYDALSAASRRSAELCWSLGTPCSAEAALEKLLECADAGCRRDVTGMDSRIQARRDGKARSRA